MPFPTHPCRCLFPVVLGFILVLAGGGCTHFPSTTPPAEPVYIDTAERAAVQAELLQEVWDKVTPRFYATDFNGADWDTAVARHSEAVASAQTTEVLYEAINTMLDELDDAHTGATTPYDTWEEDRAERAYVGLNFQRLEDQWVVVELRPGSAAVESGIQPGWVALARDGEPLPEKRLGLSTTPGRAYTWTFRDREDRQRDIELVARALPYEMPTVEDRTAAGWLYLRFDSFDRDHARWLSRRLKVHTDAPGLILDLRSNSGGEVVALERTINNFFPTRVPYGTFISRTGKRDDEKSAWSDGADYDGALAVLIGPSSASSAEILSHVLQHYDRAVLIGRTTAGAVIKSRQYYLSDGGTVQVGFEDFVGIDGSRLEGHGVIPDIAIERTLADYRADHDPDLAAAERWLAENTAE